MTFPAIWIALYVADVVAERWVQTGWEAGHKGDVGNDSWRGHLAAGMHVATYTVTAVVAVLAVAAVAWWLGMHLAPGHLAVGLAVNALSHWWAPRRWTLAALARWVGNAELYCRGGRRAGGAYLFDQVWHVAWLTVAALLIAR